MHIYFSGIGGAGIGPLAQIAHGAGFSVSGSDKRESSYINYLRSHGINDIYIDQSYQSIQEIHNKHPIDWIVYSSALTIENPNADEIIFAKKNKIKHSKRDEFLNSFIKQQDLHLLAIAGTHGKTTVTAMIVYGLKQLKYPLSYILPAKVNFGDMGEFNQSSKYFVYEADEFDHNFLSFSPYLSIISGISWDHHEIYLTIDDYKQAFQQFISQSKQTLIWNSDANFINLSQTSNTFVVDDNDKTISSINLLGLYNRRNAYIALQAIQKITNCETADILKILSSFPGLSRRMEKITTNLYSDYAHTPEKIIGAMNTAQELAETLKSSGSSSGKIIIIYEPLTNRRQHYIKNLYKDLFQAADRIYWVPSYLAREDSNQAILTPDKLIKYLSNKNIASASLLNEDLKESIATHLSKKDLVIAISGGGGNSLDSWIRENFNYEDS